MMPDHHPKTAFIGGTGLYDMESLSDRDEVQVDTPFGEPSDRIVLGSLEGSRLAFLPRHGRGHRVSPTEIPARANIYALKSLGVERVVSISAVGSLKESVRPLDLVVPDQLIDRTTRRTNTFFDGGVVAHVAFADPYCPDLRGALVRASSREGMTVHGSGACVVVEGPQFSTRAESQLYHSWGADIIGMTALPEARLAREAEMCYATLAFVTDYDSWHETEEAVSVELVIANLHENAAASQRIMRNLVTQLPNARECQCPFALKNAIVTSPRHIPESAKQRLSLLAGAYLK